MIRGGMGVRKRLEEESFRPTYRLNGVQRGATIAECLDRYGRWEGGYRLGVLVRKTAHWVQVKWDDEDEIAQVEQGEARYKVDRGLWRITNPRIGDPLSGEQGIALTTLAESARIQASANADSTDRGAEEMAREKSNAAAEREAAQQALKNGELKDRETYTAKQVAYRCGTDAKTMRKFFRSKASTVEPVGQGGRYEFDAGDMPRIKAEFDAWRRKADSRSTASRPTPRIDPAQVAEAAKGAADESDGEFTMEQVADAIERAQEQDIAQAVRDHFGDDHEPTAEELEEMARVMEADSPWEPHPDLADVDPEDFDLDDLDAEES